MGSDQPSSRRTITACVSEAFPLKLGFVATTGDHMSHGLTWGLQSIKSLQSFFSFHNLLLRKISHSLHYSVSFCFTFNLSTGLLIFSQSMSCYQFWPIIPAHQTILGYSTIQPITWPHLKCIKHMTHRHITYYHHHAADLKHSTGPGLGQPPALTSPRKPLPGWHYSFLL